MKTLLSRTLYPAVMVLASVLVGFCAAELILRAVDYRPQLQSEWVLNYPSFRVLNRDVILIPPEFLNASFYATDPQRRTIVTIGDSFTAGYPVEMEHSYPAILERILNQHGAMVHAINAGIGDSGPDQHLRLLQQYLLPRLNPAIVVWAFYANDVGDNFIRSVYGIEHGQLVPLDGASHWLYIRQLIHLGAPLPEWIKKRSYVYRLIMKATETLGLSQVPDDYARDRHAWGLKKLRLEIKSFKELGEKKGFRPYFVLIAPQAAYLARGDSERWTHHWSLREHEMILTVLRDEPNFIQAWFPTAKQAEIFASGSRDTVETGNRHFNEAGYALLAEIVAERILRDEHLMRDE